MVQHATDSAQSRGQQDDARGRRWWYRVHVRTLARGGGRTRRGCATSWAILRTVSVRAAYRAGCGGDVGRACEPVGADREGARAGHDLGCVTGADLGEVLAVDDVADPVRAVLDLPVPADPTGELPGCGLVRAKVGDRRRRSPRVRCERTWPSRRRDELGGSGAAWIGLRRVAQPFRPRGRRVFLDTAVGRRGSWVDAGCPADSWPGRGGRATGWGAVGRSEGALLVDGSGRLCR